jgi:hypothetical protein
MMTVNVLERTRELGVMRAIGAKPALVLKVIVGEGVLTAAMSWFVALLLSLPLTRALDLLAARMFGAQLPFTVSIVAAAAWFGLVLVIAAVASAAPRQCVPPVWWCAKRSPTSDEGVDFHQSPCRGCQPVPGNMGCGPGHVSHEYKRNGTASLRSAPVKAPFLPANATGTPPILANVRRTWCFRHQVLVARQELPCVV